MNKFLNIIFYIFLILNFSFFQSNVSSKNIKKEKQKNIRNGSSINNKNIENKNDNIKYQLEDSESIEKQDNILNMYNDEREKNNNNSLETNVTKNTVIDNSDEIQTSADDNIHNKGISVNSGIKLKHSQPTSDNYKNEPYQIDDKKFKYGGLFNEIASSFFNFFIAPNSTENNESAGRSISHPSEPSVDRSEPSTTSAPVNVPQVAKESTPSRPQGLRASNRNENNENGDAYNNFFAWEFGGGAPTYKPDHKKNENILLEQIKITSWDKEDIIKENEDTKHEIQENEEIEDNLDMEENEIVEDQLQENEEIEDNLDMEENEIVEDQLQENKDDEDHVNLEDINKNTRNGIFEEQMKLDSTQDEKNERLIYEEYKKTGVKNSLEDQVNILVNLLQTNNQLDTSLKDLSKELIVFLNNY
ncbi:merozoite surface protein [Plasmodium sp. DRC-Itaito]|nr:merozoite surface protein [Plasmodium sp. DRC-Itaito]